MGVCHETEQSREVWNKGKLVGQKPPLRPKDVWAIRIHLQNAHADRDLALFNLAIDSKLRACGHASLRVRDVTHVDEVLPRAQVVQRKTQRPFNLSCRCSLRDEQASYRRSPIPRSRCPNDWNASESRPITVEYSPALDTIGTGRVLCRQYGGQLAMAAPSNSTAASCISELTLPTHCRRSMQRGCGGSFQGTTAIQSVTLAGGRSVPNESFALCSCRPFENDRLGTARTARVDPASVAHTPRKQTLTRYVCGTADVTAYPDEHFRRVRRQHAIAPRSSRQVL